jgi:hypothetical protein
MVTATVDKTAMDDLEKPGILAQRIIGTIAPYVQEIVARSPVRGELALKREVKDGRREELFISVRPLTEMYANLGEERQQLFDVLDLGPAPGGGLERTRSETGPVKPLQETTQVEAIQEEEMLARELEQRTKPSAGMSLADRVDQSLDTTQELDSDDLMVEEASGAEPLPSAELEQMIVSEEGEELVDEPEFEESETPLFNIDMLKKMQGDD